MHPHSRNIFEIDLLRSPKTSHLSLLLGSHICRCTDLLASSITRYRNLELLALQKRNTFRCKAVELSGDDMDRRERNSGLLSMENVRGGRASEATTYNMGQESDRILAGRGKRYVRPPHRGTSYFKSISSSLRIYNLCTNSDSGAKTWK